LDGFKKKTKNQSIFALIIFLSIFILIILLSVDFAVLNEITQHPEYFYASETVGLSMYPQLYTGDMIIIQTIDHPEFSILVGDIIVYQKEEHNVGHRVLQINEDYYVTKGDNNIGYETVYPSQVLGRVYKIVDRYNPIGQFVFDKVI